MVKEKTGTGSLKVDAESLLKSPVHLVCGADEFHVAQCAREIVDLLCPAEEQALSLDIFEGRVESVSECADALSGCLEGLRTLGFFGGRRVVWLRDVVCFGESAVLSKSNDVKDRIAALTAEIQSGLGEGQYLVVSAIKVDKRSAFVKACQQQGKVHVFDLPDKPYLVDAAAAEWANQVFNQAGLKVASPVTQAFVAKVGADRRQIVQEVEKLATYLNDRKVVEVDDVRNVVSISRTGIAWDLADAFGKRDLPETLRVLRQLLFQRESPVGLLFQLMGRIRDLLIYRSALDQGWLSLQDRGQARWSKGPEIDEALSGFSRDPRQNHPFRAGLLAKQASNFTGPELVRCHATIMATHETLFSSGLPKELLLEILLIRLLGQEKAGRGR